MSQQPAPEESRQPGNSIEAEAKPASSEPVDGTTAPPGGPRARGFTAWLALLVALAALAASGYLWTQQQAQQRSLAGFENLDQGLSARVTRLESLEARVTELTGSESRLAEASSELREMLADQERQLERLPLRLNRLERALENIPGVAGQARSVWLLAEAEYYLRIANAQLALARNPGIALRALELADEKLMALADPALIPVRARLAEEITALRSVPRPDTEGMVLRLGSLESALGSLPLDQQIPDRYGREATSEDQVSGLQRAWESVKAALLSIISVRRTDQAETLLLSADEEGLLRRGMITELQIAQLALIRGEPAVYRYMLESVTRQLNRHFDQDAPAVQAALAQLETLAAASLPEDLPDISGSLELLRRHESAESP